MPTENGLPQYVSRNAQGNFQYYRRPPKGVAGAAFVRSFRTKDRKVMLAGFPKVHAEAETYFTRLISGRVLADDVIERTAEGVARWSFEFAKDRGTPHKHDLRGDTAAWTVDLPEATAADVEAIYQRAVALRHEHEAEFIGQHRTAINEYESVLRQATPKVALKGTSMEDLFKRWVKQRTPTPNSENEYRRAKDLFVKIATDKPITEYTSADARAYKDAVLDLIAPNGSPLAHGTRVKWFSSVKTLFKLADKDQLLLPNPNPFEKITLDRPKKARTAKREDWEIDDLNILFQSEVYTKRERPRGGAGEASYWLPVLALYHGFRAGELCQLDKADVVQRSGIWCLNVAESNEDDEHAPKSTKTEGSIRTVPIHSAVIKLGFLDYIRTVKGTKLWPKIEPDSIGRWAGNYSKWFGRYRKKIELGGRWRDFHSFRHTWKTAARGAGIPKEVHDEITGHENGDVGSGYGKVPVSLLKTELEKIKFKVSIPKWTS